MPTLVNNLRAIRGPVTAVPMVGASGVIVEPDTANNQVIVRADETVLWEGSRTNSVTLSQSASNFEYLKIFLDLDNISRPNPIIMVRPARKLSTAWGQGNSNGILCLAHISMNSTFTSITIDHTKPINFGSFTSSTASFTVGTLDDTYEKNSIVKVVGVNRIANS